MLMALQVVTLLFVAIAMALTLAHALELPGKMRLSEETYRAVQPIYYPGFTFGGGLGEGLGLLAVLGLLFATPSGSVAFWLTLAAFVALAAMHAAYWLLTHPVNNFWVKDVNMGKAGSAFFGLGGQTQAGHAPDWRALRDRWEYSHVVRAALGLISQTLLIIAIAL
jgi:hypothetical protein